MIPLELKSRQCLIDDIKCLETQLSDLQERFDVIINWIRLQYHDLIGLPDLVIIAVEGANPGSFKDTFELTRDKFSLEKVAHVKVEYDNLSNNVITDYESESDDQRKNLLVKLDDEIMKGIESGKSRLRIQLQKRKLAYRENLHSEEGQQSNSSTNQPAAIVHEDVPSFPQLFEEEDGVKWENDHLSDVNQTEGNDSTSYLTHSAYDANALTLSERAVQRNHLKELSGGIRKRVKKTPKHIQANREKGLILDAVEYKQLIASLPKERLFCAICKKDFSTSTKVRRHEFEVHLTKEEQNKLRNRSNVPNVDKEKNVVATMCDICKMPFKNIESHKLNHLPSEVMTTVEGSWRPHYRCLKCDSLFSDKKKYLGHVMHDCKVEETLENSNYAQHTQKLRTEKNFLCNQCGISFNRKHTLKRHEMAVHANKRDFKCQYCEKAFVIEYLKNCHEKKHLGTSSVTCDLCGFSFTCKATLRKHIRGVHENRRPFQCPLCDKSFKTSNARNYHVNTHGNPNGRKRGLNREVDPIKAAAKRRHCITWKRNRVQTVTNLTTEENEHVTDATFITQ